MAVALARWSLNRNAGRKMFAGVAVFGVATVVFSLSTSFPLSLAALAVLGAADMVSVVVRQTLVQIQTPDNMRGRVTAVSALFIGTSNQLGEFRAGTMAEFTGALVAVLAGGVGTLMIVALWAKLFPALMNVDDLTRAADEERPKRKAKKDAHAGARKPPREGAALERRPD
jgi:MFS family permease